MLASFPDVVPDLVVVLVAVPPAILLLVHRRGERQNLLLAIFLLLIAVSFGADALGKAAEAAGSALWQDVCSTVDAVVSSLDAFFLFAFVTEHPYVRRTRLHRGALAWLALAGATAATLYVVAATGGPEFVFTDFLLGIGITGIGYAVAWAAAVGSLRHAPTEGLLRRARWACLAVGIATVPRFPVSFSNLAAIYDETVWASESAKVVRAGLQLLIVAAATLPAYLALRRSRTVEGPRTVAIVALVSAALVAVNLRFDHPLALRWLVFSCILAYAILAHQVIRLPAATRRVLLAVAAAVVSLAATSLVLDFVPERTVGAPGVLAIAAGVGLAALLPGVLLARRLVAWAERTPGENQAQRRLALYSAAVEAALAGGTPGRLPRARRDLGVSREEARVVEDLVHRSLGRPQPALHQGDEPLPGIVVERPLAGGAQGQAFLARRLPEGAPVVVKQLPAPGPGARQRLWKELEALRSLEHPSLPRLRGFTLDPVTCVAYDYVPGATLAEALRKGPLDARRLRPAARDLAAALHAVHGAGFVHGDVKPANVVLGEDGRAHLIDFGLAEARPPPRATLAGDGPAAPVGTLEYMAPELARTGRPTPASDVYALGAAIHEALTGRRARRLDGLAVYQALDRVAREPLEVGKVPERWRPFLRAALDPDPGRRPSAAELAALVPDARAVAVTP